MMQVQKDSMVSIHYTMTLENGETVYSSRGSKPIDYLHGYGNIVSGLEEALEGASVGATFEITLPPEKRYGEFSTDLVKVVPRSTFADPDTIAVGMTFIVQTEEGPRQFVVKSVTGDEVEVDGNHPLAGETIHYSVSVEGLRDSTPVEREDADYEVESGCPNTGCCG